MYTESRSESVELRSLDRSVTEQGAARTAQTKCPDCPALRRRVLGELVPADGSCEFQRLTLEARASLPPRLFEGSGFALVRRGIVIRQRADAQGRVVSIDAAGPGALLPLGELGTPSGSSSTGYAATMALLCVYPWPSAGSSSPCMSAPTTLELYQLQREALHRVERIADARSRSTVERRVAALLCALSDTLSPPVQREAFSALFLRDLAALIDTRHESVCRILRRFTEQGWIERTNETIVLREREVLENL